MANIESIDCCPQFNPLPWDSKILEWNEKKFVKDKVRTLFYMPLNFGSVITKIMKKIAEAQISAPEWLCLSDSTSAWNMDIYLAVDEVVSGLENVTISGTFFSKVYEGNFKNAKKWCTDFEAQTKKIGLEISKTYMWYTTCPKCAKKYGNNYVVVIGKIEKTEK
ncbi:MAG: hypothetical protein FWD87_06600 [Spirochaetaceae bacterium]|nr:hypothetical protein [Spirochaetaceae bacterium]